MKRAALLVLILSGIAFSLSIGAAPGVINFGEVHRGKQYIGESYLLTLSSEKLLVSLAYAPPHRDWMVSPSPGIDYNLSQGSEEDISNWVKFPQNPTLIDPAYKTIIKLPNGQTIAANKKMTFYLKIPKDAEPGYHIGSISMVPKLRAGTGTGVSTIGITRIIFTFKVPGEVRKDLQPIAIEAKRLSDKQARIDVLVKNKGTVTTSMRLKEIKIFDRDGNVVAVLNSGYAKIRPGETAVLSAIWTSRKRIKSDTYKAKARVEWYYGESVYTGDFSVPEEITLPQKKPVRKCKAIPIWAIVIVSIVALAVVYFMGYAHPLVYLLLGALVAYRLISCGSIEWWAVGVAIAAFIYDRVVGG